MNEKYILMIELLTHWYEENIKYFPSIKLTEEGYKAGTDSIKEKEYIAVINHAFHKFLYEFKYELSYNQSCNAFFAAMKNLNKLEMV